MAFLCLSLYSSNEFSPSSASTVRELWTSRCSSWIYKRQRNQRSNYIHWIIEKARPFQKNISFCFIDYTKVFDSVDHNKLWTILKQVGIPDHLTCLLRNLCVGQDATVKTGLRTTDWVQIRKGVHQGCIFSPCLLKLYAEYIMRNTVLMKHKLESRVLGEISIDSDMQMTPPSWQKVKKN